jgi:hypothetical protein
MGDVVSIEQPENYALAIRRIRKLWYEGEVTWTTHVEKEMKRRKLLPSDLRHIIKTGIIVEHSRPQSHWRYEIRGQLLDGGKASCIVEINGHLIVVTCYVANRWP